MATRFTNGDVTVELDDGLERFVRKALEAANGEVVRLLEEEANAQKAASEGDWYKPGTGVTEKTGRSGTLEVVTTVSMTEVRVSLRSTDTRRYKSKPLVALIHRPRRLSTLLTEISAEEYRKEKERGGDWARLVFFSRRNRPALGVLAGRYYRIEHNPLASDGKYLLAELLRKPMKARVKRITPALGRAIATKIGG